MAQPPNPKRRSLPLPDWRSGLPEDLLESIGQRLASGHDATSFRSACSPWRAAVLFVTFGPLLMLPFDPDSDRVGFYYVPEKKVLSKTLPDVRSKVACGSSCGWLALIDEAVPMPPALSSHQQANTSWWRPHRNACLGSTADGSCIPPTAMGTWMTQAEPSS